MNEHHHAHKSIRNDRTGYTPTFDTMNPVPPSNNETQTSHGPQFGLSIPTLESILYSQLPAPEKINKIISLVNETK